MAIPGVRHSGLQLELGLCLRVRMSVKVSGSLRISEGLGMASQNQTISHTCAMYLAYVPSSGESTSIVLPTLGSRTAKEQNRTERSVCCLAGC